MRHEIMGTNQSYSHSKVKVSLILFLACENDRTKLKKPWWFWFSYPSGIPAPCTPDDTDSLLPQCKFLEHKTPMISKFNKAVGYKEPLTMLSWVCLSIGHRGRQINIKTKKLNWRTMYSWVSLMTSSLIYFVTDSRKHRTHLFYISNEVKSHHWWRH